MFKNEQQSNDFFYKKNMLYFHYIYWKLIVFVKINVFIASISVHLDIAIIIKTIGKLYCSNFSTFVMLSCPKSISIYNEKQIYMITLS